MSQSEDNDHQPPIDDGQRMATPYQQVMSHPYHRKNRVREDVNDEKQAASTYSFFGSSNPQQPNESNRHRSSLPSYNDYRRDKHKWNKSRSKRASLEKSCSKKVSLGKSWSHRNGVENEDALDDEVPHERMTIHM
ncbi:hypothetical protein QYF36_003377 [Acer negundo]|nr:hypothetical protein QYF36_003377 [Acer negundo]